VYVFDMFSHFKRHNRQIWALQQHEKSEARERHLTRVKGNLGQCPPT